MRRFIILLIVFFGGCYALIAQQDSDRQNHRQDSLREKFQKDSLKIYRLYAFKVFGKLENRYSFMNGGVLNYWGIMQGITFNDRHSFYFGFFWMNEQKNNLLKFDELRTNMPQYKDFNYIHTGYRYVIHDSRHLRINLPMLIGYGNYKAELKETPEKAPEIVSGKMIPLSLGLHVIYKIVPWAGIAGSGGYQYFYHKTNPKFDMQGWYFTFGIWIDGYSVRKGLRYHFVKKKYTHEMKTIEGQP